MKTLTVSLPAAFLLLLLGTAGPRAQASPSPPAVSNPPAVLSQTVRGVTATLADVQWVPIEPPRDPFTFYKSFSLSVHLSASRELGLPPNKTLLSYVTAINAISPSGSALGTTGGGESRNSSGGVIDKSANWDDIDPRWPLVAVDVDMADPAASPRAIGHSSEPIILSNIPVPTDDNVLATHVETMTPLGTRIVLEKVKVAQASHRTTFVVHVIPDPKASDLQFILSGSSKVTDDTGAKLNPHGNGTAGNGDLLDPQRDPRNLNSIAIDDVPTTGAKTLTLTLGADESSEALRQDAAYRHFHFIVPMRLIDSSSRRPHSPLATVQGEGVAVTLDSITTVESRYRTRFTLRDLTGSGLTWRLDAVRGKDQAGNPLTGRTSPDTAFFWKTDGSPLALDEEASEVILGAPGDESGPYSVGVPKLAQTLSLEADVSGVQKKYHLLDFVRVPVPKPGQVLTLNRTVRDASGARLVLRKVAAYSLGHPLPTGTSVPEPYSLPATPAGMVVVLAEPPSLDGNTSFDYHVVAANDPLGLRLAPAYLTLFTPGDALHTVSRASAGDPARVETYFLRLPSPNAHTFNLRLGHETTTNLNKHETLVFPAVEAPMIK